MTGILHNKRIIVTGGTTGIGHATAVLAAQAGADVAFCGLTEEGAAGTSQAIEAAGRHAFFRALDLSNLDAARQFARDAIRFLGGLDGLVNNAGTNFFQSLLGATYESIQQCLMLNFYASWAISQEAYPALKVAGGGMIVNLASIHAQRTGPGVFPYNVSKAMMAAMTQSMALEWGSDQIQAVAIAPGLILTPLAEAYFNTFDDPAAEQARMESRYPLKRGGRPEDIGSLIVFLLSRQSLFISGTTILVDGAMSAQVEPSDN
jgi:NAD(P)-dependent dehydrogenase (short-subunit alcohol dehydrogenase family)